MDVPAQLAQCFWKVGAGGSWDWTSLTRTLVVVTVFEPPAQPPSIKASAITIAPVRRMAASYPNPPSATSSPALRDDLP